VTGVGRGGPGDHWRRMGNLSGKVMEAGTHPFIVSAVRGEDSGCAAVFRWQWALAMVNGDAGWVLQHKVNEGKVRHVFNVDGKFRGVELTVRGSWQQRFGCILVSGGSLRRPGVLLLLQTIKGEMRRESIQRRRGM
jgi:hypothetical protein